jgi:hypothetical protein
MIMKYIDHPIKYHNNKIILKWKIQPMQDIKNDQHRA